MDTDSNGRWVTPYSSTDHLTHGNRTKIDIFTLDKVLADDIYSRIYAIGTYKVSRPYGRSIRDYIAAVKQMANKTVDSKLLILDVRTETMGWLGRIYNKIIPLNRKDINNSCRVILIGGNIANLKSVDKYVNKLTDYRTHYLYSLLFYDPFIDYTSDEKEHVGIEEEFKIVETVPKRFFKYFHNEEVSVEQVRKHFRALHRDEETRERRLTKLRKLFKHQLQDQFCESGLDDWFTKEGIKISTERLHLYPLFFEEWVVKCMEDKDK